mmetsp:Transcript_30882/g.65598  ORF Transcript_30882/g.65598 Transcript_30882/m.65598 type:complete len:241 (+) Transcript_30882:1439-2161(+)
MELFPPFFFFPPPSSSESYASAFTLSMAFFLASSAALLASSSSLAFFAAASLLALTSANLAISLLYSSVSPASCLLRYAAAFSSFSFSSRSFLVIGTSSATTAVPRSFIFIMRGFVPPPPLYWDFPPRSIPRVLSVCIPSPPIPPPPPPRHLQRTCRPRDVRRAWPPSPTPSPRRRRSHCRRRRHRLLLRRHRLRPGVFGGPRRIRRGGRCVVRFLRRRRRRIVCRSRVPRRVCLFLGPW